MYSYDLQVEIWPNLANPHLIILWLVRICLETIFSFFLQIKSLFKELGLFILYIQMIYK
jgi:hypothetical protein